MYSLENFDEVINIWLATKLKKAKNKVNAATILKNRYTKILSLLEKGISKRGHLEKYKTLYYHYSLGDIKKINNQFNSNNYLVSLLTNEEIQNLVEDNVLELTFPPDKVFEDFNPERGTPPASTPKYHFTNNKVYHKAIKAFKDYILLNEAITILSHILTLESTVSINHEIENYIMTHCKKITVKKENISTQLKSDIEQKTKLFPKMPLSYAKIFFSILTTQKNKENKPYLTEADLNTFIERAFMLNKSCEKVTINYRYGEKTKIQSLFHCFYTKAVEDLLTTERNIDNFVRLLTDNFEDWEYKDVEANFSRQTKFKWVDYIKTIL